MKWGPRTGGTVEVLTACDDLLVRFDNGDTGVALLLESDDVLLLIEVLATQLRVISGKRAVYVQQTPDGD